MLGTTIWCQSKQILDVDGWDGADYYTIDLDIPSNTAEALGIGELTGLDTEIGALLN